MGIINSHRKMFSHRKKRGDVIFTKSAFLRTLDGDRTQGPAAINKRQCHFRARMRQMRILEMHTLLAHIQCDARFAHGNTGADHGVCSNFQLVTVSHHGFASLAIASAQDSIFAFFIQQENARIIQAIGFANNIYGLRKQLLKVKDGGDFLAHTVGSF